MRICEGEKTYNIREELNYLYNIYKILHIKHYKFCICAVVGIIIE